MHSLWLETYSAQYVVQNKIHSMYYTSMIYVYIYKIVVNKHEASKIAGII